MVNRTKTAVVIGGAAVAILAGRKLLATADSVSKVDFNVKNINFKEVLKYPLRPKIKLDLTINNPSASEITLSKPYIRLTYKGSVVGNTPAENIEIVVPPRGQKVLKEVVIEIASTQVMLSLLDVVKGKGDISFIMTVIGTVNGLNYTQQYPFIYRIAPPRLGLVASSKRAIKNGRKLDSLFPEPKITTSLYHPNGNVRDTANKMIDIINSTLADTAKIAKVLKGDSQYQDAKNVWNFTYNHLQYQLDEDGLEQLRRPSRSWYDGNVTGKGVDCDCMSIFNASILKNMGHKPVLRIAKYQGGWQHVYVILKQPSGNTIIIDTVLDRFDYEKPPTDTMDFNI